MNHSGMLSSNATEPSRIRYQMALELAQACPGELGTRFYYLDPPKPHGITRINVRVLM